METERERRIRLLRELVADFSARGVGLRMAENLPRDELYDRGSADSPINDTPSNVEG